MLLVTAWAGLFPPTPPSIQTGLPPRHSSWATLTAFKWTGNHTVAEASKEEYDSCSDPGIWIGSPVNVNLVTAGSRYFICTVGDHCEQGQKVTITVGSLDPHLRHLLHHHFQAPMLLLPLCYLGSSSPHWSFASSLTCDQVCYVITIN